MTDVADLRLRFRSDEADTASRRMDRLADSSGRAERGAGRLQQQSGALAGSFRTLLRFATPLAASLAAAFGGRAIVSAQSDLQTRTAQIEQLLRQTGRAAQTTFRDLEQSAQSLARTTLLDVDEILQAQQQLLTFRNVTGDVFDEAIRMSGDLSAAMGQDLVGTTRQLARALEDPVTGMQALTRSGTVFTQQQRDMVREMVEAGNTAEAQRFILAELEAQYGGAAGAGSDLAIALDSLGQSARNFRISFADAVGAGERLSAVVRGLDQAVQVIDANMGRFIAYLQGAAVAGMWVFRGAIIAVTSAIWAKVASLAALRAMLIRTGVGALVVGLGELIFWLTRASDAIGGIGRAFNLIANIGQEAVGRLSNHFQMLGAAVRTRFNFIKADIAGAMDDAIQSVTGFASNAIGAFQGAYDAIRAVWGQLPAVIGDLVFQAANSVVQATGQMLDNVAERINAWLPVINSMRGIMGQTAMQPLSVGGRGGIENRFEGEAAKAGADAADAFRSGFEGVNLEPPDTGLRDTVREASQAGLEAAREVRQLQNEFPDRWESVEALRRALDRTSEGARAVNESLLGVDGQPLIRAAGDARQLDDALADIGGAGGGSGGGGGGRGGGSGSGGSAGAAADGIRGIGEAAQQTGQVMQTLQNGMANAFAQIVTGAQSAREALGQLLNQLANVLANSAFQALLGGLFGGGGSPMSFTGWAGAGSVPVPSFAGGGFTGTGARSGGMDGRGGFPAILHPNETVVDHTRGGGAAQQITIRIAANEMFDAKVAEVSDPRIRVAIEQDNRQNFNRRAQAARQDPRRRG